MKTMNKVENKMEENEEEEEDEETRDFYIYILSREQPTVLTPVANPYKRSDKIKEANAQLQLDSPIHVKAHTKLRFSETPVLHEYIKEEDILLNTISSPETIPINAIENELLEFNKLTTQNLDASESESKRISQRNNLNEENTENNQSNKENIKHSQNFKSFGINREETLNNPEFDSIASPKKTITKNHIKNISNPKEYKIMNNELTAITNEILNSSESLLESLTRKIDAERNKQISSWENTTENSTSLVQKDKVTENLNNIQNNLFRENGNEQKYKKRGNNEDNVNIGDDTNINDRNVSMLNELNKTGNIVISREQDKTKIKVNGIEEKTSITNIDTKLNYKPSSAERKICIGNTYGESYTTNYIKNKVTNEKEEKYKTELNYAASSVKNKNGIKKSSTNINKNKPIQAKLETATETKKKIKNHTKNLKQSETIIKCHTKEKDRGKLIESKNSSRPTKQTADTKKELETNENEIKRNRADEAKQANRDIISALDKQEHNMNSDENTAIDTFDETFDFSLSTKEVKAKLKELKERNRSKLVVLVPPFEQYKSYMNDNYSDSDDESLDLEEFLSKEKQTDLYLPDFELESDIEFNDCLSEKKESVLVKKNICEHKKRTRSASNSDRKSLNSYESKKTTKSLEEEELIRHRCKMIDNIKNSQDYDNAKKFAQNMGGVTKLCKQKCSQRPSTAPAGKKFGCDCKWPRVKLPEYNGLRSEYGLSAEQLCDRKRQKQEIARRTKERKQRKSNEEERRKLENERMFHEWLIKKRQQAKEQWMRNQRLRAVRYSKQCTPPSQQKNQKVNQSKNILNIRKKLHPGRNCFSLDEIINDVNLSHDEKNSYKIYLGLSIE